MLINDIAKIAGVGVGTVSRVINNHPDVSDKTREKVLKVIKENNYVPNNSARILKMNATNNIGVLVRGVFNPFFAEITDTIRREIEKAGYLMILHHNDYVIESDSIKEIVSFIKENKLKGLIYLGARLSDIDNQTFENIEVPIIFTSPNKLCDNCINTFSSINIKDEEAAYNAVKYLIDKGHREIGIVLGNEMDIGLGEMRFKGYLKALAENNIDYNEDYVIYGNYNYEGSYNATKQLLNTKKEITALFAISDIMAVGAAKAISDNGLLIGRGISLVGFDGMDIAKYYTPSITTIKQPRYEMAKSSTEILIDLINKKSSHKHLVLETELIEGESVVAIRR